MCPRLQPKASRSLPSWTETQVSVTPSYLASGVFASSKPDARPSGRDHGAPLSQEKREAGINGLLPRLRFARWVPSIIPFRRGRGLQKGFLKQYVRDHLCLRTETATNDITDYRVKKAVENLPQLRDKLATICDNYLTVQQDILETFVDRGQLRNLAQPTVLPGGKRIPGLKLDNPRQLALMHALVRFAHIAAGNTFTTAELYPHVLAALQMSADQYSLASLRYDLSKLRAKALVEKLPQSRRYRLCSQGYCICLVFLKLFERIYAPLTAGLL